MVTERTDSETVIAGRWSRKRRDLATIAWVSFLIAVCGSVVTFALLDPPHLSSVWSAGWELNPISGHVIIFLFIWLLTYLASWVSVFMLRTGPPEGHARGGDGVPITKAPESDEHNPGFADEDWL